MILNLNVFIISFIIVFKDTNHLMQFHYTLFVSICICATQLTSLILMGSSPMISFGPTCNEKTVVCI